MVSKRVVNNADFVMSLLRSQVETLNDVVVSIERSNTIGEHVEVNLKRVETNIRGLRKLFAENN